MTLFRIVSFSWLFLVCFKIFYRQIILCRLQIAPTAPRLAHQYRGVSMRVVAGGEGGVEGTPKTPWLRPGRGPVYAEAETAEPGVQGTLSQ